MAKQIGILFAVDKPTNDALFHDLKSYVKSQTNEFDLIKVSSKDFTDTQLMSKLNGVLTYEVHCQPSMRSCLIDILKQTSDMSMLANRQISIDTESNVRDIMKQKI